MELKIAEIVETKKTIQTGTNQAGKEWQKQYFGIMTEDKYPKLVVFTAWKELIEISKTLKKGDKIEVSFYVESKEYNEKFYTNLTAWKIQKVSEQPTAPPPPVQNNDDEEELPF